MPELSKQNKNWLYEAFGYTIERGKSTVKDAGTGVIVTRGTVPKATVVGIYPGVYLVIPRETEGYGVERVCPSVCPSVRLSVCPSVRPP